jgi:uncharacterized protein YicC (UPF0701 family)
MVKDIIDAIREFLNPEIKEIKSRLESIDARLSSVENDSKENRTRLTTIEIDMRRLEAILLRIEDKINLSERVTRIETFLEEMRSIKK